MLWNKLPKPFFALAPMDDVTDTVFRRMVASLAAPNVFFSEFASVDGFMSDGRSAVEEKLFFTPEEKPLIAQIWGLQPDNFRNVAATIATRGYSGIDINMGCPQKKIIKNGACAALINNRPLAAEIIAATKEGLEGKLPLSVKTRIGFNKIDLSWTEFLLKQQLDALVVHGRTVKEMSGVANHWDTISEVVRQRDRIAPDTLIIGNGDISDRNHGLEMAVKHKVDGLMIGRGVFSDPFVFAEESPWNTMTEAEKINLYRRHIELFIDQWGVQRNPAALKKFAKVYISGFDGASDKRQAIMNCNTAEQMLAVL